VIHALQQYAQLYALLLLAQYVVSIHAYAAKDVVHSHANAVFHAVHSHAVALK